MNFHSMNCASKILNPAGASDSIYIHHVVAYSGVADVFT